MQRKVQRRLSAAACGTPGCGTHVGCGRAAHSCAGEGKNTLERCVGTGQRLADSKCEGWQAMVCVCVFQKRRLAAGLTQTSQAAAGMGYNHQVSAAVVKS